MAKRTKSGLPIEDATKPLTVHITAKDVTRGMAKFPGGCAAAVALVREVPGCTMARVHLARVFLRIGDKKWLRFLTPHSLRSEIVAFDRGGKFEPGDHILLPVPPSVAKQHGRARSPATLKRGRKGHHRPYHILTDVRPGAK